MKYGDRSMAEYLLPRSFCLEAAETYISREEINIFHEHLGWVKKAHNSKNVALSY